MCYYSGDPADREVLQLTLSPCIHATAGLRISDRIVCAYSEMQMIWVSLGPGKRQDPLHRGERRQMKGAAISLQISFSRQEIV